MLAPVQRQCSLAECVIAGADIPDRKGHGRCRHTCVWQAWFLYPAQHIRLTHIITGIFSALVQLQTLVVDIGPIAEGYKIPGQFVQIKVDRSPKHQRHRVPSRTPCARLNAQ